jgi:predicted RNA binding protein YcfA (HicA-like mRNA interferase family)
MMDWSIDYLENDGIVCIKTTGLADWDQNMEMCKEGLAVGRRNGSHRFLVDQRGIESVLTILQVDDLPGMLKQIGVTAGDKIAVVFDRTTPMSNTFAFFKNASFLESLKVELFTDPDKAIAWLKSDLPDEPKR